jgi:hypothetical protein
MRRHDVFLKLKFSKFTKIRTSNNSNTIKPITFGKSSSNAYNNTNVQNDSVDMNASNSPSTQSSNSSTHLRHSHRRRRPYVGKKRHTMRTNVDDDYKVNSILFILEQNFAIDLANTDDMCHVVSRRLGIKVRDCHLKEKRLFVSPKTEVDHDEIIKRQNRIPNVHFQTIYNKNLYLIIKELSCNDINRSESIKKELLGLGIVQWWPLVEENEDSNEDIIIKCKCSSRGALSDIMIKHFASGKYFTLIDGYKVLATFQPFSPNPVQCYKCHSFDGHLANKCPTGPVCERCGSRDHSYDSCGAKTACCVNCKNDHESTDRRCEKFQDLKKFEEETTVFHITGQLIKKNIVLKGKRKFNEITKKFRESYSIANNVEGWKEEQSNKVAKWENRLEESHLAYSKKTENLCSNLENTFKRIDELSARSSSLLETVESRMKTIAQEEAKKTCRELEIKTNGRFDAMNNDLLKLVNANDTNVNYYNDQIARLGERSDVHDKRLKNIENILLTLNKSPNQSVVFNPSSQ